MRKNMNDASSDFVHLSQAIHSSDDPISHQLVGMLEKCLSDNDYLQDVEEHMVAYAATQAIIKKQLTAIAESNNKALEQIKPIAEQFLKKANSLAIPPASSANAQPVFFKEPPQEKSKLENLIEEKLKNLSSIAIKEIHQLSQESHVDFEKLLELYKAKFNHDLKQFNPTIKI